MKHIKNYNESVRQYLKPKSNEEILFILFNKSNSEKTEKIIGYQLDFSLLPRNDRGTCFYHGNLFLYDKNLTKLPDNLIIYGRLNCSHNKLTKLSDKLVVIGDLDCSYNDITELPDNLIVDGNLLCNNNKITELPNNLIVKNTLFCNTLPKKVKIPRQVYNVIIN